MKLLLAGWLFAAALAAPLPARADGEVQTLRFPIGESIGDHRNDYPRKVLELALSKGKTRYRVVDAAIAMNQNRQVAELEAGRLIDVASIPTSPERERRLLPVRIPINKGLLGWRIGLVRQSESGLLADVKTAEDLGHLRIAQGSEWPDTEILRSNGIQVIGGSTYAGLFEMLQSRRFDYFPRSVLEIWDEQARYIGRLEIERHVALHYFYDGYFFVNKHNARLAEDIRAGLEQAIADGSFEQLFQEQWGALLQLARLNERRVIELRNPLMPPETPIHRPELWYR
jgi:hypothetical protein